MPRDDGVTKSDTATGWIAFDQVEIDLAGRRLFVAGVETPLEPKAFAVLALLARNPGQAFTRDEILDAVWGHRHVTPGVLNRVITLLRQALGESAGQSHYLNTIHGVGYRFDATLRARHSPAAAITPPPVDDNAAPPPSTFAPAGVAASPKPVAAGRVPRSRIAAALVVVAALVLAAGWLLRQRVAGPPAATPPSPTLIVLPLRVVGAEHDESVLGDGLSEELITRLSGVDGLRLISRTSAALARSANLDLAQLATKLGVTHALEGSLQQSDQQLRIELRLLDVATGRTLWAQSYDRAPNNVLRLESEIAQEVAQALALRFGLRHTNDATIDPRLYQRYLLARRDAGRGYRAQAIEQLQAIVREAPAFAPAHATLARLLVSNLRGTEPDAAEIEEGRGEAQQALALDPNLAETQAALAVLSCRAAQWARCVELFKHALGLDPSDSDARTSYAYWLSGMGYLDEALSEAETAWRYDPLNGLDDFVRGRLLDTLGRHDEAWQFLEGLPNPYPQWFNAVWRHDYAKARELIDRMPEEQHFRESYIAVTAALQDPTLWPQALAAIEDSERRGGRVNFDRLLMPDPDYAIMIPALEKMLREGWPSYYLLMWMPEQARLRADPRFSDMLQRTGIIDYWNSRGWPPQCHRDGARAVCP